MKGFDERSIPKALITVSGRDAGFSAVLFTSLAAFVYPHLPASVLSTIPLPAFTALLGGIGIFFHRWVTKLWQVFLGDIAKEGAEAIKTYITIRKLQWWLRRGFISRRRAQQLTEEFIKADIARSLPQRALGSPTTRKKIEFQPR